MRSKDARHEARRTIVEAVSDRDVEKRFLIEAVIELAVTIEEVGDRIVAQLRKGDHIGVPFRRTPDRLRQRCARV